MNECMLSLIYMKFTHEQMRNSWGASCICLPPADSKLPKRGTLCKEDHVSLGAWSYPVGLGLHLCKLSPTFTTEFMTLRYTHTMQTSAHSSKYCLSKVNCSKDTENAVRC